MYIHACTINTNVLHVSLWVLEPSQNGRWLYIHHMSCYRCICVYKRMYTCILQYVYMHMYIHMYMHIHMYIYIYIHAYTHQYIRDILRRLYVHCVITSCLRVRNLEFKVCQRSCHSRIGPRWRGPGSEARRAGSKTRGSSIGALLITTGFL